MWDKADIRIPFKRSAVVELACSTPEKPDGILRIENYDFPAQCSVAFVDGQQVNSAPRAQKWGTISSGISSLAVGFFPEGNGFFTWPHVSIKASPSKILQGHNVFGSDNIREGVKQMFANLSLAFPKIFADLDIEGAEVRYLDSTYSAFVPSEYQRNHVLKIFEGLFPRKKDISRYQGYLQANRSSEYFRQKVYYKHQELMADLEKAKKTGDKVKAEILSDPELIDFANGRMRFEATTGHRALENLGIPTKLTEFLTFHDWFKRTHKQPLAEYLWHKAFDRLFAQLEGHTMKNVDDDSIRLRIDARYIKVKENGRICRRQANAIFQTYRNIKAEGYDQLAKENKSNFFRNVKALEEIGISRGFLKSLDPSRPNDNVIPFVKVINIDFSQQRPDWYVEPKSGFDDRSRHLRLVS